MTVICGLAFSGEFEAKWSWYIGESFGRTLEPSRRRALDAFDLALRDHLALNPGPWAMGPDVNLRDWLKARGRSSEYPAPKAEPKPKKTPPAPTRGRRR